MPRNIKTLKTQTSKPVPASPITLTGLSKKPPWNVCKWWMGQMVNNWWAIKPSLRVVPTWKPTNIYTVMISLLSLIFNSNYLNYYIYYFMSIFCFLFKMPIPTKVCLPPRQGAICTKIQCTRIYHTSQNYLPLPKLPLNRNAKQNDFGSFRELITPCFILKTMWNPVKAGLTLLSTLIVLIPIIIYLFLGNKTLLLTWDFFNSPTSPLSFNILLDINGLILISVVIFISSNVLFFTTVYIQDDPFTPRFTALVISFIISICLLVLLPNLITLLIGWDGLGLTSYLLVLYYQTPKSQGAAIITAITNRLGDVLILFTIAWCINTHWIPLNPWSSPFQTLIAFLLITAAITKRAQFPFISWLPAAIAAPTPVSALVHSSTLVTAGIFILIRFFNSLKNIPSLEFILLFSSALTACIAGLAAIAECDIKKIIALSTLSQLGTIIYRLAIQIPSLAFFHLVTHALFKSLLFMAAGTLIHYHHHGQDLRSLGLLNKSIPLTSTIIVRSRLALCGAPYTAGFYSKDLIIESHINNPTNFILILVFILATRLTTAYRIRFLTNVVWSPRQSPPSRIFQVKPHLLTIGPIIALAQATLFIGSTLLWLIILPNTERPLPILLKLQALIAGFIGFTLGWIIAQPIFKPYAWFINNKLVNEFLTALAFTTPINAQFTSRLPLKSGQILQKTIDGGWVETLGGQGTIISYRLRSSRLLSTIGKSLASNLFIFFTISITLIMF